MLYSLKSKITLTEEIRQMYSIIESTDNQIRKHKRPENSMYLLLVSKKATPYFPVWAIMINNA